MIWVGDRTVGSLVPQDEALVSVRDRGFTVGEGVFETVWVTDGRPFALSRHLRRLVSSARILGIAEPDLDVVRIAVDEVLYANAPLLGAHARLRITYTAGGPIAGSADADLPTLTVVTTPATAWPDSASVVTSPWRRNEWAATVGAKCTSYADSALALADAKVRGADEAIMANTQGNLCEGTASNVFVVMGGSILTPPLDSGCLPGITRQLVIEWCGAVERPLSMTDLAQAQEIFLTSSSRSIHPVTAIDGRAIPVGDVTKRAAQTFRMRAAEDIDP